MTKDAYHHGNLRVALIEAAFEALVSEPATKISLRRLASRVGVSANAPYTHFADKDALLSAVAREGFALLERDMSQALEGAGSDRRERLAALGAVYLRFGCRHRNLYGLMFGGDGAAVPPLVRAAGQTTFALLRRAVDGPGQETSDLALAAWALVHGLVTLNAANSLEGLLAPGIALETLAFRLASLLIEGDGRSTMPPIPEE